MPANPLRSLYAMRRRELAAQSLLEDGLSRREVLRRGAMAGRGRGGRPHPAGGVR